MDEVTAAEAHESASPVTIDVVMRLDPMTFKVDELDVLSRQFAGWVVTNVTKMTEPQGADLFVAVVCHRDGQLAGCTYREGRFFREDTGG